MQCRNCTVRMARLGKGRRRGLCKPCEADPAIRERFPIPPRAIDNPCRHCGVRKGTCGRRLCKTCYHAPGVLALYPVEVRETTRGKPCRHCAVKPCNRPRGLCWECYYTPGLRDRYAPVGKYAVRGVGSGFFAPPASEPTAHPPGSPGKVEVLMRRARDGTELFHPDDGRVPPASPAEF